MAWWTWDLLDDRLMTLFLYLCTLACMLCVWITDAIIWAPHTFRALHESPKMWHENVPKMGKWREKGDQRTASETQSGTCRVALRLSPDGNWSDRRADPLDPWWPLEACSIAWHDCWLFDIARLYCITCIIMWFVLITMGYSILGDREWLDSESWTLDTG